MKIDDIQIRIINDSRGDKTLEVNLILDGQQVTASVPSGKSKGSHEVFVLEPELAIKKLEEIKPKIEKDFESLEEFDQFLIELDGTAGKKNLGGNLILALSIAFVKAWAKLLKLELFQLISRIVNADSQTTSGEARTKLPLCFFNLIEGGMHAHPPAGGLPFQEYLLIPQTNSPKQSLEIVMSVINLLKEKIQSEYGQVGYGDEGGFTVPSDDALKGLRFLQSFGGKLGLDVAASTMQQKPSLEVMKNIVESFPVLSIEDPFDQEDWDNFSKLTALIGNTVWIVGDDLTTTNVERIKLAYEKRAVNAIIIKPNQIGSVTEAIAAAVLAKSYGWKIIVSHRSGETLDTFIADLSVGLGADGLKSGCPLQKERLVKYQRLIEIESILNSE